MLAPTNNFYFVSRHKFILFLVFLSLVPTVGVVLLTALPVVLLRHRIPYLFTTDE